MSFVLDIWLAGSKVQRSRSEFKLTGFLSSISLHFDLDFDIDI